MATRSKRRWVETHNPYAPTEERGFFRCDLHPQFVQLAVDNCCQFCQLEVESTFAEGLLQPVDGLETLREMVERVERNLPPTVQLPYPIMEDRPVCLVCYTPMQLGQDGEWYCPVGRFDAGGKAPRAYPPYDDDRELVL